MNLRGELKYKSGSFFSAVSYCFVVFGKFKEVLQWFSYDTVVVHREFSTRLRYVFCSQVLFRLARSVVIINSGSTVKVEFNSE